MQESFKTVPIDYTLVKDQNNIPIGSESGFRDVPEWIATLLGLPVYH